MSTRALRTGGFAGAGMRGFKMLRCISATWDATTTACVRQMDNNVRPLLAFFVDVRFRGTPNAQGEATLPRAGAS